MCFKYNIATRRTHKYPIKITSSRPLNISVAKLEVLFSNTQHSETYI